MPNTPENLSEEDRQIKEHLQQVEEERARLAKELDEDPESPERHTEFIRFTDDHYNEYLLIHIEKLGSDIPDAVSDMRQKAQGRILSKLREKADLSE